MRTRYEAAIDKRNAVKDDESSGLVADNIEVRKALMDRVHSGEISLDAAKEELKKIKRSAKSKGLITRQQAFSRG